MIAGPAFVHSAEFAELALPPSIDLGITRPLKGPRRAVAAVSMNWETT
jgi:hypothetical protein